MARITLRYDVRAGLQAIDAFAAQVAAVNLYDGELEQLGMIVETDDTVAVPGDRLARRTIVLATTELGDELWTTEEALRSATRQLYTGELALRVPAPVRAAEPVVSDFTPPAC
jgi:hypothetical protein